jgi:hypothetical protein
MKKQKIKMKAYVANRRISIYPHFSKQSCTSPINLAQGDTMDCDDFQPTDIEMNLLIQKACYKPTINVVEKRYLIR